MIQKQNKANDNKYYWCEMKFNYFEKWRDHWILFHFHKAMLKSPTSCKRGSRHHFPTTHLMRGRLGVRTPSISSIVFAFFIFQALLVLPWEISILGRWPRLPFVTGPPKINCDPFVGRFFKNFLKVGYEVSHVMLVTCQ